MESRFDAQNATVVFNLEMFHVSEDHGFLLPNPLKELPGYYQPWMEIALHLHDLIENHKLQSEVNKLPLLRIQHLNGHRQLRLAHLMLSCITMGYVWQEGEHNAAKVLPKNLAVPYYEVSKALGLPPVLVHADNVLANWKKKDPTGPFELKNLDTIVSLPGGESADNFFIVTALVEKAAIPGIKAVKDGINALLQGNDDVLVRALQDLAASIADMKNALKIMHDHVNPRIFYGIIRLFLSGWKDNPAIPDGLLYEEVSQEPLQYSGGSAAQSTTLQCFDEFLGVVHTKECADFLNRMRDYMPPSHKAFIQEVHALSSVRAYIMSAGNVKLTTAYNLCITALKELRNYHISMVTRYIIVAAANVKADKVSQNHGTNLQKTNSVLEERGTGGTGIMCFLKSVRDTTKAALMV
ncbi:indoleamine 2,3-dioxygenase 2-like [Protopterus annectens]|uniref:indoleamine 2,3-dioxygenase 2-like n=1 Tax=Protopterus annectens TaxID=7888 RepID=UPI001CFBAC68|nr:indoleamine 2,3-dioxygenase 2-like [Protopterus annectens]